MSLNYAFINKVSLMLRGACLRMRRLHAGGKRVLQSALFRGGAASLFIQAQFVAVQFLTTIILTRILSPTDFGIYSFALAVMALLQVIPSSGLEAVIIRYSPEYHAEHAWARLRGLWRTAFTSSTAYGVVAAAALLVVFSLRLLPTTAAVYPPVLAVAALPMFFLPQVALLGAALRAIGRGVFGQLPLFVLKPWIFLALLLAMATVAPQAVTAELAMFTQGAAAFVTTLVCVYWLLKYQPEQLRKTRPTYESARWMRSVPFFAALGGLMLINRQTSLLMLGILGSARETGVYRVAANVASLVSLSLAASDLYIGPRVSAMYSRGERVNLQRLISMSARFTFAVALAIACTFWLWGSELLRVLFGQAYLAAFWPMTILCFGHLINVGAGSVGLILMMTGHERDAAWSAVVAAVFNVGLNFILIPMFGDVGAATSTTITMLIWNGMMLVRVSRKVGFNASIFGAKLAS